VRERYAEDGGGGNCPATKATRFAGPFFRQTAITGGWTLKAAARYLIDYVRKSDTIVTFIGSKVTEIRAVPFVETD
jgi:hypothetical protein